MNIQMTKRELIRGFVLIAISTLLLVAALIFMLAVARIWVIGRIQGIMISTTVGTSIKQTEGYLGPPINEQTKAQWQKRGHAESVHLPDGTERIVAYLVLGGHYCYVFLNADGFILGTYWFKT